MFPLIKTLRSLKKARLYWLMLACAALAIAVAAGIVILITWLTAALVNFQAGWVDWLVNGAVGLVSGVAGWFMLPALTVLIAGMFQEVAIDRVERVDYPDKVRQEGPRFWPDMRHDLWFTLWAVFLNALILPLYLLGVGFAVSIVLNTHLLGREFFESAAGHHVGKPQARRLGRRKRIPMYLGGLVITLMTLTPLLNFFTPIIAVVWMVHVHHLPLQGRQATGP